MKPMIQLMLVDDEHTSHQAIIDYLSEYENIIVCCKAYSEEEAKLRLRTLSVDAVFLDVELGNGSGFELADHIRRNYPDIALVFITGHMEYAITGYDYEPLDYLVKPVDPIRLSRAIDRIEKCSRTVREPTAEEGIALETPIGSFFVPAQEILYCELRGRRMYVGRTTGDEICCTLSIDRMEKLLAPFGFLKVYQSVLIRKSEIASVEKEGRGQTYIVRLKSRGLSFPASRKFYYEIRKSAKSAGCKE